MQFKGVLSAGKAETYSLAGARGIVQPRQLPAVRLKQWAGPGSGDIRYVLLPSRRRVLSQRRCRLHQAAPPSVRLTGPRNPRRAGLGRTSLSTRTSAPNRPALPVDRSSGHCEIAKLRIRTSMHSGWAATRNQAAALSRSTKRAKPAINTSVSNITCAHVSRSAPAHPCCRHIDTHRIAQLAREN